jgi:hypothetical protein
MVFSGQMICRTRLPDPSTQKQSSTEPSSLNTQRVASILQLPRASYSDDSDVAVRLKPVIADFDFLEGGVWLWCRDGEGLIIRIL